MRRNFRKFAALALFFVLVMCPPMSVAADESGQAGSEGSGQMAKVRNQNVYQVLLPTDVNGIFDFMIDPQKLIEETNAAAYGGKSFEKGATVFFHRMDGQSAEEYSSSSDHVTIVNRSTVPVEVMVNVSVSPESLGGITMADDRTFAGDSGASLYMALTDGVNTVPVGTGDSWIRTTIPAAPKEAFEYSYDQEREEYNRALKQDLSGIQFPEYSFQLIGAANEKGDWSALGKVSPLVNVTWKVTPSQSLDAGVEEDADENLDAGAEEDADENLNAGAEEDADENPGAGVEENADENPGAGVKEDADGRLDSGVKEKMEETMDSEQADILTQILKTEPVDRKSAGADAVQGNKPVDREPADEGLDQGRNPMQDKATGQNRDPVHDGNETQRIN